MGPVNSLTVLMISQSFKVLHATQFSRVIESLIMSALSGIFLTKSR